MTGDPPDGSGTRPDGRDDVRSADDPTDATNATDAANTTDDATPLDRARAALRATPRVLSVGGAAVAGSVLAVGTSTDVVVAPVSRVVTDATPGFVVTFAITRLGDVGEQLALVSAVVLTAALLGAAGVAAATLARRRELPDVLAGGVAAAALAGAVTLSVASAVGAGAGAAVGLAVARLSGEGDATPAGRRSVLKSAAVALGAGALGVAYGRTRDRGGGDLPAEDVQPEGSDDGDGGLLGAAEERSLDVDGLEPLVSEAFYEVDISQVNPQPDPEEWTLSITGAVGSPTSYDLEDITGRPAERRFVTLRCVGENLNGRKLDNALWTGVPVTDLLDGVEPEGQYVMVRAADGYFEEFPAEALSDAMIAYGMNGGPLPRAHGAPARLLVPGHWGEINVKWVTEIEFLEREQRGYWELRGWHGTGPVNTVAKLWVTNHLADGRVEVAGHAYAGTRGIERVEVSTDGGATWTEATLSDRLPGRVVDGDGSPSDATATPDGGMVTPRGVGTPTPAGGETPTSTDDGTATASAEGTSDDGMPPSGAGGPPEFATDAWRQWVHRYEPPPGDHEVVVRAVDGTGTVQPEEESRAFPSGPTGWVSKTVSRE